MDHSLDESEIVPSTDINSACTLSKEDLELTGRRYDPGKFKRSKSTMSANHERVVGHRAHG